MSAKKLNFKFTKNLLSMVGVTVKEGQSINGVELAPKFYREAGITDVLKGLGWQVRDVGDVTRENIDVPSHSTSSTQKKLINHEEIIGAMNKKLHDICHQETKQGRFMLNLGGDHGLASGTISGSLKTYPNLKVIWVDSHGDALTPETCDGYNWYHGMPMGHLFGWFNKNHHKSFDWLKEKLDIKDIVYIGLRDLDRPEKELFEKHNVKFYTPYDIDHMGGIKNVMDETLRFLKADKNDNTPVHVSWDVDACDPYYIYGTGTKARAGLTERESHYMLMRLAQTGNLVSLDMVEANPALDKIKDRDHFHGDKKIKGPESICNSIDLIASSLGFTWRH